MIDEFDAVASEAWQKSKPFLHQMYDALAGEGNWEPAPPQITYRIYDRAGQPITCHLCGETDKWTIEGDEAAGTVPVFVCDHGLESGIIRKVSSVPSRDVSRFEVTGRPPE